MTYLTLRLKKYNFMYVDNSGVAFSLIFYLIFQLTDDDF